MTTEDFGPRTTDGRMRVAVEKADLSKATLYSHDWTDKTTWAQEAARVVDEVATDSGDHQTYSVSNQFLIDAYHGKITQEDFLADPSGNSYRIVVTVNDVAKVEQDPHTGSGGDFTVDYAAGTITFLAPLVATDVVKVTYHYAGSSLFTIKPDAGKDLLLDFVEVQFSGDVILTDTVLFQAKGYCIAFAPQLAQSNGGPYPDTTLLPLGNAFTYKGMRDFMNDAVRSYVKYPAGLGGSSWRGLSSDIYVFDWDYVRSTRLQSDLGMQIDVSLEHDTPFGGSYATATFYCSVENS